MSFARVRALVVVGMLAILALVFIVAAMIRDTQGGEKLATGCQHGEVPVNPDLREPKDIKINVYNGTNAPGLAEIVGTDFGNRKFQVEKKANDPLKKKTDAVAVLRYGPKSFGAAHLLRAYFLDEAIREFDPKRQDDVVDVVIGSKFQQLATTTEVNQSLAGLGDMDLPDGTCVAKS